MKVLAIYSAKGGVGKTTTAIELASIAASCGHRTLLWDLDAQGAATFAFRIARKLDGGVARLLGEASDLIPWVHATDWELLDLVPADLALRNQELLLDARSSGRKRRLAELLAPLAASYDLAILDCPPTLSLLAENVFRAASALLVPTIPAALSARTLVQIHSFLQSEGPVDLPIWPFFSMVDRRRAGHRAAIAALRAGLPRPLETEIPLAAAIERMAEERIPLSKSDPTGRAHQAFVSLWNEIRGLSFRPPT